MAEMVRFHEFERASTTRIERVQGLNDEERDSRVQLHIIVSRKLLPITTLTGNQFLAAWWQIVTSHRALWKKGVWHCDISPSNFIGYNLLGGRFIAVLIDFDLSSTSKRDGPSDFECIGTVSFMALDLLMPESTAGQVEHVYYHVAESFIWVLTWICLRYERGKLLRKDRPLDEWLAVDAVSCVDKKTNFMFQGIRSKQLRTPISHNVSWEVAKKCLAMVYKHGGPFNPASTNDEEVFQTWLQNHVPKNVLEGNILSGQGRYTCS